MTLPPSTTAPRRDRSLVIAVVAGLAIVALDIAVKRVAEARLPRGEANWLIDGWVGLERTTNSGVAFSLLDGNRAVWILLLVAFVGLGWVARDVARSASTVADFLPAAAVAAGALGNLFDRLGDGRVTDLFAVGPWPRFNIADSALTIGLVLLLVQASTTKGHDPDG